MQKILHTMLRVTNLQKSIDFYTKILGMRVVRTLDQASEQYCLTFLGYGNEEDNCVLELTYNYGVDKYEIGNGYGHLAISVEDCQKACDEIRAKGIRIAYEATKLAGSSEIIAFISDPDGYSIELIERI